jgi:hypothetical protein
MAGVVERTYALVDLARVKEHGEIETTSYDQELVRLTNEVSRRVEGYLGRHLMSREWAHNGTTLPRLNTYGGTSLVLPNWPVTAVSGLKLHPDLSALTEGYDEDYVVDEDAGIIELLNKVFYCRPRVCEVTYTAGYLASPADDEQGALWGWDDASSEIQLATAIQVVWQFRQKQREREGVASRSEGGVTITYLASAWVPEAKEILDRHRRDYV